MPTFEFEVNGSFIDGSGHPITIPKSQLAYPVLLAAGLDHEKIIVILPHGERYDAGIYHGEAGYGEYYQLRFNGATRALPNYLKIGDRLIIVLIKAAARSYFILEYR